MRLNQYIARSTGISRRKADVLISNGNISINGVKANVGQQVNADDQVALDGRVVKPSKMTTLMINKPVGYVCSRDGQGSKTIYDLLPAEFHDLKPVGRLDKDSSGLLLMTNDGHQANQLTHPRYQKDKVYSLSLDKTLQPKHQEQLLHGVQLDDGPSKFTAVDITNNDKITVTIAEGRNRQIRRTFEALGYKVMILHRTKFGAYELGNLQSGKNQSV